MSGGIPSQIHGSAQRRPRYITTEEDEEHPMGRSVDGVTDESVRRTVRYIPPNLDIDLC